MRLLLDENPDVRLEARLANFGHDVLHVRNSSLRGRPDSEALDYAGRESRIVVTLDADFGNVVLFPPERFGGIIRLRLRSIRFAPVAGVLERLLTLLGPRDLKGRLVVANETRFRIR